MVVVGSCAHASVEPFPDEDQAPELALFRTILESMEGVEGAGVDPRPLRRGDAPDADSVFAANPDVRVGRDVVEALMPSDLVFPDSTNLAPVPREAVAERTRVLVEMGFREVDYFSDQADCPGLLVPPGLADRSGCPETWRTLIIVTEPRPAESSRSGVGAEGEEETSCHWSVMVTIRTETPGGATTALDEFILSSTSGRGWEVIDRVSHLIVE
jgi:hypothetical protein